MISLTIRIEMARYVGLLALLTALTSTSSCGIIPTPPYGGYGVIKSETIEFLTPGQTTRAEVLLRFGNPNYLADDQLFAYRWQRTHAFVGSYAGGVEIKRNHYLALEFSPDNRLKRFKLIEPWLFENSEQLLKEWIVEKGESFGSKSKPTTVSIQEEIYE